MDKKKSNNYVVNIEEGEEGKKKGRKREKSEGDGEGG
jgi:hypothetical protein